MQTCTKSIGEVTFTRVGWRLLRPPSPQYTSRGAAAAAAAARAGGGGAAGARSAAHGHPAAGEARSWGPLGRELWMQEFNPTPVRNRRGGPLRPPAGGKFEFEPTER
jgi:hypothetical protein